MKGKVEYLLIAAALFMAAFAVAAMAGDTCQTTCQTNYAGTTYCTTTCY